MQLQALSRHRLLHFLTNSTYVGGVSAFTLVEDNFMQNSPLRGLTVVNSSDARIYCNDIATTITPFSLNNPSPTEQAIYIGDGSGRGELRANTLSSREDLYTRSLLLPHSHKGNCFNGLGAVADGINPGDIPLMRFLVDSTDQFCFMPTAVSPSGWFVQQTGYDAESCFGNPSGNDGEAFLSDTTRVCEYLRHLDSLSQIQSTQNNAVVRIINFLRTLSNHEDYAEEFPDCVETF